jgi:ribosomal-protein-alanine N-acetyltransferase
MQTRVKIRPMTFRDISEVICIEKQVYSWPWSSWIFFQELVAPERYYIVAEIQGEIVGYAGLQWILEEGHVTNIAVKKSWQRRGIGSILLENLIARARELNLKFITLEVRVSNFAAQKLYQKFGFVVEGMRKNYYVKPVEDAVIMTLYLR